MFWDTPQDREEDSPFFRPARVSAITATPTRTIKNEQPVLLNLFGRAFINQVECKDLIARDILASPRIVTVKTHADVDKNLTPQDPEHVLRFHDLSEAWFDRIALSAK